MDNVNVSTQVVLNTLPIGTSVLGKDGTIIFMNDCYAKALGEYPSDFIGTNIYSQEHLKRVDNNAKILKEVLLKRDVVTGVYQYFNQKKGRTFKCKVEERPIIDAGVVEYVLVTVLNIHDMGQKEEQNLVIGNSLVMQNLLKRIQHEAQYPTSILLTGETGVGKDVIARYIHQNSRQKNGPFVVLDCASLSENLIESELFGYEKGAFTGAERSGKRGIIEEAKGGTLFLDEINSLPLHVQGKLLRVLESHKIRRVGGVNNQEIDFRLISASNQDLMECVRNKTFRDDLYYRISIINENIPPLRERREDIIPLVDHFQNYFCEKYGKQIRILDEQLREWMEYDWPGNVRELRNLVERVVIFDGNLPNQNIYLPQKVREKAFAIDAIKAPYGTLRQRLEMTEREIIHQTLLQSKTQHEAAQKLGIDPAVLSRKLVHYGLRNRQ